MQDGHRHSASIPLIETGQMRCRLDGTHKLPVRTELRRRLGKEAGEQVSVRLEEGLGDH